ncbi:hypothetical protein D3871_10565 [Noviherbaspirillum saxi]|uniref:Uncharacterized protein n=2 Tax=Noviherbaspirillum saxi TaxID=2320863 RepID=A0A3A3G9R3_9BURK|nr:hypothetical protein D3871_10565 [Noviherbaspirillum saxi]
MQLGFKTTEMLFAAAQVINHRTTRMALAGPVPNARDRKEFTLMGQEKVDAAAESVQAMTMRMFAVQTELAGAIFRQFTGGTVGMLGLAATPFSLITPSGQARLLRGFLGSPMTSAARFSGNLGQVAHHGLKPIHSRATGNAKRLAKL